MRTPLVLTAALLAATGCTPGDLAYTHTSEMDVASRGVEYTDDQSAQVGMNGVTCAVNPDTSMIEEDVDVVEDDDEVTDAFEGEALIVNGTGVRFYDPQAWTWDEEMGEDIVAPSLQTAGFTLGGTAVVDAFQGCNVSFHGATTNTVSLDSEACIDPSFASSGLADTVAVATRGEGWLVRADGVVTPLGGADHVTMDESTVYATAGTELSAYGLDGSLQWTADLGADVVDLHMVGNHAAVMLAHSNGEGELRSFDPTGLESSSLATPVPADAIRASDSGRELAMILPSRIHFFQVRGLN